MYYRDDIVHFFDISSSVIKRKSVSNHPIMYYRDGIDCFRASFICICIQAVDYCHFVYKKFFMLIIVYLDMDYFVSVNQSHRFSFRHNCNIHQMSPNFPNSYTSYRLQSVCSPCI